MSRTFITKNHKQRSDAVEFILNYPGVLVINLDEPKRSIPRNSQLHAVLTDISDQVKWDGEWLNVDQWKRLLTAAWMRATGRSVKIVRAIDGTGVEPLYQATRDLNESECRELIQYIYAWGVDQEPPVMFKEPTPEGWRIPDRAA
jgi:hypothetical protein